MLSPISVDFSLPTIPAVARYFGSPVSEVQFSLSALVFGIAVGQLLYGPLSDRFGRKPVIVAGAAFYVCASLACASAPSVDSLLGLRFLQGCFACSGLIVARAVIRDLFDGAAGARLFAMMMGIHGIMPTIGPGVGGWLTQTFGWQAPFYGMAGFGAFTALAMLFALPETARVRQPDAIHPVRMLRSYREILRDGTFRSHATCACCMYGALLAYFAGAPVGLIGYLGLTPAVFGVAMAMPMLSYMISQMVVARFAHRLGIGRLIRTGAVLASCAGIGMLALVLIGTITIYSLIGPVMLVLVALSLITPGTTAGAMSPFPHMAGATSSLLGFIQFLAGAAATAAVGALNDGTPLPMAAVICACTVGALISWWVLVRPLVRRAGA